MSLFLIDKQLSVLLRPYAIFRAALSRNAVNELERDHDVYLRLIYISFSLGTRVKPDIIRSTSLQFHNISKILKLATLKICPNLYHQCDRALISEYIIPDFVL